MASQNVEIAEKGYAAYAAGDIETALNDFDDNIEWSIPGNSTLGGTYRGKGEFMQFLGKLAEKSFTTTPERILGDGDDVIVITKVTAGWGIRTPGRCVDLSHWQTRESRDHRRHCHV